MPTYSRVIPATIESVFAVLSDYQRYPDWTPDVVAASVLAREGDVVVAEFLTPFLSDKKYVLEFVHSRPRSIVYKQTDQFGARGVHGAWHLAPAAEGRGTSATATLHFRTQPWRRMLNRRRAALIVERRLDALQELFARGPADAIGPPSAHPSAAGEPLLDVLAGGEPATVSWMGTKYLLTRIDR